jgi:hypothetical protein
MRKLFITSLAALLLLSCEKENTSPISIHAYFPLETGNYWIYGHYRIDSQGNEILLDRTDSVVVSGDTMINGLTYHILEGNNYPHQGGAWMRQAILRDSMNYLVDEEGRIRLSTVNFDDILEQRTQMNGQDSLYTLSYQMVREPELSMTPAGTFRVINFKGTVVSHMDIAHINYPRRIDNHYAHDVGPVMNTYLYLNDPSRGERRLLRYGTINGPSQYGRVGP